MSSHAPGTSTSVPTKGPSRPPAKTTGTATTTPSPTTATPARHTEVGGNKNGSPTFADTKAIRPGHRTVAYLEVVEVSCKVYDTPIGSALPGGYWYRLSGTPWNNAYYAVANTFANGDTPGDPHGTTDFDPSGPDC